MNAEFVIDACRKHMFRAAFVTEVTMTDPVVSEAWTALRAANAKKGTVTQEQVDLCVSRVPAYRRIDALAVRAREWTAIEVKVTKKDFLAETEHKTRAWRSVTHRFVYAVPEGLVQPSEVPAGMGLWWVNEDGKVTVVKRATKNKNREPIPEQVLIAMCFRAMKNETGTAPRRRKRVSRSKATRGRRTT